jgi:prolyl-tRNA synthetase
MSSAGKCVLVLPVYHGEKTESERFPGAVQTLCIEAMVQDRKAIQAGTSHFLGQNFAKASGIKYISRTGKEEYVWTTSWGVSTRLIGTVIMSHADDDGLILPPRIAPAHVVILPITPKEETKQAVLEAAATLKAQISAQRYANDPIRVEVDQRDIGGGAKNWDWIKRGVPVRIELGPRDLAAGTVAVSRRDQPVKEKMFKPSAEIVDQLPTILGEIQKNLYDRAKSMRDNNTVRIDSKKDFYDFFMPQNKEKPEIHGGFALAHWSGSPEVEAQIKQDLKVTIRCIPFDAEVRDDQPGQCVISGEPSPRRVLFAKSY